MVLSPYEALPARAFWRPGVAERQLADLPDLYAPKFKITATDRIVTAGSCFAQHVGRALQAAKFTVIDTEPGPKGAGTATLLAYGFEMYSARYGNIYTARQLRQLIEEAFDGRVLRHPASEAEGRFQDAQRPNIEPGGLESPEVVRLLRAAHLEAVRQAFTQVDLFVFTLGLTEAWVSADGDTVYPTAPGTLAGRFDPAAFRFKNFTYPEVMADLLQVRTRLQALNPGMRMLLTVSPVPLTATASGHHVEVATAYSKAVLRAVAGDLQAAHDDIDYFPSYEIITSQKAGAGYYEANLRQVTETGVATAMAVFLRAQGLEAAIPGGPSADVAPDGADLRRSQADIVCEEALLEAFRP